MTILQVVFLITAAITLISAVMVVSLRKVMQSAFAFVLTLMGVAVMFAIIGSGFFAMVQVVVYIGAIAILIIFSVMLIHNVMDSSERQINRGAVFAGVAVVVLFAGLVFVMSAWGKFQSMPSVLPAQIDDLALMGKAFADPEGFVVPFELVTVLLLAAMVGGIFIAREHKER
jgi:NADH-quinone oxidoreductase subunit J